MLTERQLRDIIRHGGALRGIDPNELRAFPCHLIYVTNCYPYVIVTVYTSPARGLEYYDGDYRFRIEDAESLRFTAEDINTRLGDIAWTFTEDTHENA